MAFLLVGLSVPMSATPAVAQEVQANSEIPLTERLVEAFETGDAKMLLASAADRLAVSLFGRQASYSRGQALYVMEDFFQNHPPRRFSLYLMRGMEGHSFAVGRYWTNGGEQSLTVYLGLRSNDGGWVLREIRIERRRDS